MKLMSRMLSLALVSAFVLTAGTACTAKNAGSNSGGQNNATTAAATAAATTKNLYEGEQVTLTQMIWGTVDSYKLTNEALFKVYPELAKKVKIEIVIGGSGEADVAQKFRLALAAREKLPNMIRGNYTQLPEFAEAGVLADLKKYIDPYVPKIIPNALNIMKYKDNFYAFPQEVKTKIWWYRKDIFAECGVDPAKVKSVDDLIAAGKKIREKYPNKYIENYGTPEQTYDLTMLLSGNGGRFCDEKGNYNLSSDKNVKLAFETIKKLKDSGVTANFTDFTADWQKAIQDEVLVSHLSASWMKIHLMNYGKGQDGKWAAALWPEDIRTGSESGGGIWMIPKDSDNKDLSADILSKLSFEKEGAKAYYETTGRIPALKDAASDPTYTAANPFFGEKPNEGQFKALDYFKIYPYTPASTQEMKIVTQYLNEYCNGKMTVDAALQQAEADLKNQIGNPYKK